MFKNGFLVLLLVLLAATLIACGGSESSESGRDKMVGHWTSNLGTLDVDKWDGNTTSYTGAMLGSTFAHDIFIVDESADFVIFDSETLSKPVTCTFSDDDQMVCANDGGIPVVLDRD